MTLLAIGLTLVAAIPAAITGYLTFLTVVAAATRVHGPPDGPGRRRFGILVPAHDEELSIGRLLASVGSLTYPRDQFDLYVVADNCTDNTATIARAAGARVLERSDRTLTGKGFALRDLLTWIERTQTRAYDAFVVADADTVMSANFLRRMDGYLEAGHLVVQGYYTVLNPGTSAVAGLRSAALSSLHYVRPKARAALGWSCGLKGNGMCFEASTLQRFGWSWFTLAEDVEFHLALVRAGIAVAFAQDAIVEAEMPSTFAQASSQNARWESGRLALLRTAVGQVLLEGIRSRRPMLIDAALEQLIPPLSVPFGAASLLLMTALVLNVPAAGWLASLSLVGMVAHILFGLRVTHASPRIYLSLVLTPAYVIWKIWLYARIVAGRRPKGWVRTGRAVS